MSETNICISCLANENVFNIFDTHECEGNDEIYYEMLKLCFNIDISKDSLVQGMCERCILELREAYFFKQNIMKNIEVLSSNINIEDETLQLDPTTGHFYIYKDNKDISNESQDYIKDVSIECKEHIKDISNEVDGNKYIVETVEQDEGISNGTYEERERLSATAVLNTDNQVDLKKCIICEKLFETDVLLAQHLKKAHDESYFLCRYCNKVFKNLNTKNNHVYRVHTSQSPYGCTLCSERFKTYRQRLSHLKNTHNIKPNYPCTFCDKVYFDPGSRSKHINCIHRGVKNHKCSHCKMAFFRLKDLLSHLATIHDIGEKNHVCPTCHKRFFKQSTLRLHMETHTKVSNNRSQTKCHQETTKNVYRCDDCGDIFKIKAVFKNHIFLHRRQEGMNLGPPT